jgi:uncharacterized membrane protein YfcA
MDLVLVLFVMALGAAAGGVGAVLGLGGGVFLVPLLTWLLGLPVQQAAGVSLMTVIATSGAVSTSASGRDLVNLRLGMLLMLFAALGGLFGGLTAQHLGERALTLIFAITTGLVCAITLSRLDRVNVLESGEAEPNRFGGRFYDADRQRYVVYRLRRLPLAMLVSLVAGNVSGLLGVGGGILQVPALNAWCGVPIRVAAATSAFLIGITALASAPIYFAHGDIDAHFAAAAVLGVLGGSRLGLRVSRAQRSRDIKLLLAGMVGLVSLLMFIRVLRLP